LTGIGALPKPLSRAAALGLVVVALGFAALAMLVPFAWTASVSEEIAIANDQVVQQERLLRAAARRPAHAARDMLVTGETSGLAGAELQRVVTELARRSGLSLRSTHVAPTKREADLAAIGVEVSLQGQMEGLRAFIHAIETGTPILFIETLSIKSVPSYQPVPQPVPLDVTLRVRGYGAGKEIN
jgi:general secretion pathway protein M